MEKKHTFSLLSFIRQEKQNKRNEAAVYLRITVDSSRVEISTKIYVDAEKWLPGLGRVKGKTEEVVRLNNAITNFEHRGREIYNRFIENGKLITAVSIKNEILGLEYKQHNLLALFSEFVIEIESRLGNGYSYGTLKNWRVTRGHLKEFLQKRYKLPDISFKELKLTFITDFDQYARVHWKCRTNAVLKHVERIRKVVKIAISKDWIPKDPFMNYKVHKDKTHRTFLTLKELQDIQNKTFDVERLEKVKDTFVFSCYTGLAYVDIEKLSIDNLVDGIDGKKWIYTFRQKTDIKSNVPLLPQALRIIMKYSNHPENISKNRLLPVISNIKTNAYLKEIATLCGIKKNLTFHMARHTFATTIALSNGVPMETISNMLGHSKITTTQIYAKVLEDKVSNDMQMLEKKLKKLKF